MTIDLHTLFRELLADPATQAAYDADPAGWLASRGHDLPDELVREAIGQVAAGLPAATAEALAPAVMADSPIPTPGVDDEPIGDGLDALRSAELVDEPTEPSSEAGEGDLGFGRGADPADAPPADAAAELDDSASVDLLDSTPADPSFEDPFVELDSGDPSVVLELDADPLELDADDPADLDGFE